MAGLDLPRGGGNVETWEQDKKKQFQAKFQSYAETRGAKVQAAPKAPKPQGDTDSPVPDDEIPGGEDDVPDENIPF